VKLLRLPASKVHLGMVLPWNVRDLQGQLLLSKGHLVTDQHMVDELTLRGAFVDEEEVKATVADAARKKLLISGGDPVKSIATATSIFDLWDQTTVALKNILADPASEPDFPARMQTFSLHLQEIFDINPDIGIYRSVRQDNAQHFYYGYTHAVLTAMLCILTARHLDWSKESITSLVNAALTMNMTIFELQGQMAGQDHAPRDKQIAALRSHPADAVEVLKKHGVTDSQWLQAVEQHHERKDGYGYPTGTRDIAEMASILRLADVFIAKITPRTLHSAVAPKEALTQMFRDDKGGPLSTAMIKEFGIYPPGDFVRLASGELGLVVKRTSDARAPIVASITDRQGHLVQKTERHDTGLMEFAIVGEAMDRALLKRLAPERLFGYASAPMVADARVS